MPRAFSLSAAIIAGLLALQPAAQPPTTQIPSASPHAARGVSYADITASSGLAAFRHVSGSADKRYLIEATGSGVATWDFDNDGLRRYLPGQRIHAGCTTPRRAGASRGAAFAISAAASFVM